VMSWSLLRVNASQQSLFCDVLLKMWPEVILYYPRYTKITRPAGRRMPIQTELPVYPGYVFLGAPFIHVATRTPYRISYVRFGGNIAEVPDRVVTEVQRLEAEGRLMVETVKENPWKKGTKIVILTQAFDVQAYVISVLRNNAAVLADTPLGRMVVPVHKIQVCREGSP
jgi:hypothetical protein